MTPYMAFKRCLVDGWPNVSISHAAVMVMIDAGIKWSIGRHKYNLIYVEDFLHTIKMPVLVFSLSSVYLAACYPKTSAALFDGASRDKAFAILMAEKQRRYEYNRGIVHAHEDAVKKSIKAAGGKTVFIRARDLTKRHDWNTVK